MNRIEGAVPKAPERHTASALWLTAIDIPCADDSADDDHLMKRQWFARGLKIILATGLVFLLVGVGFEEYVRRSSHRVFPPPGRMVDVGGHELHLNCAGAGQPTILLESGLDPSGSLAWSRVQAPLAELTRVCSYDRAGMVWSEAGPGPRTGEQVVTELEALLEAAGESGPFVLVGHSHGGLYTRIFAHRFPDAVAGLVFVDATHPETMQRLPPDLQDPPNLPPVAQSLLLAAGRVGILRLLGGGRTRESYPDSVMPILAHFGVQSMAALFSEANAIPSTDSTAIRSGPFGDLPLLVLTPEVPVRPGTYDITDDQTSRLNAVLSELQDEMADLSTAGRVMRLPGVGHYIQLDDPAVTVRGIRSVLEAARSRNERAVSSPPVAPAILPSRAIPEAS